MRIASVDFVHTNSEIVRFIKDYRSIIYKACEKAGLSRCDWENVESEVALKYAHGRINYDPARGCKDTTYVFAIALNAAHDLLRCQHPERFQEMEDKDWDSIADKIDKNKQREAMDDKVIVMEALRRLVQKCHDKKKIEILLRYVVEKTDRTQLAEEYGVTSDYISGVKIRWLPCLQELVKEVLKEDQEGNLKFSNVDLRFLKPYMKSW
ncbi:MAG: hypothetical protein K5787_06815 [Lentisphaeria bacterium]|nr:hypothetical protein [Lentisphaeria bacterium]